MKISGAGKVRYDAGPNMTPLVDVVMCILIFLMLAGSFGGAEHYIDSKLPITEKGKGEVNDPFQQPVLLEIRVDSMKRSMTKEADPNDPNPDPFMASFQGEHAFYPDANSLKVQLITKRMQFESQGTPLDRIQVVINPNRYTKYKNLILVYQAAIQAGYQKVAFSASH